MASHLTDFDYEPQDEVEYYYGKWDESAFPSQSLVLDLDETLVHSFVDGPDLEPHIRDAPEVKENYYEMVLEGGHKIWGIKRPYLEYFLSYCTQRFEHVAIWSAGIKPYVENIVNSFDRPDMFSTIYSRDKCVNEPVTHYDDYGAVQTTTELKKPLSILFYSYPKEYNRHNTWIVDDRADYCSTNIMNWIEMPEFSPTVSNFQNHQDNYLLRLKDYLDSDDARMTYNVMEVLGKRDWFK